MIIISTTEKIIQLDQLQPLPAPASREQPEGDSLKVAVASILSPQGTIQSYQPFLHYLEKHLEKDVILIQKKTYQEVNDLLSRNVVDVAFVCTQDQMHTKPTLLALEKGYHVLLEKPMAHRLEDCIKIVNKVEETGRILGVCHVLRYTGFFQLYMK